MSMSAELNTTLREGESRRARNRRGRKDSDGQEQVTKPEVIQNRMPELERLYNEVRDCRADFNDAVKLAAEDSGYNAAAVRSHVVAVCNDRVEAARVKVNQQLELFEFALISAQPA